MTNPIDLAMQALEVLRTEPMAKTAADKAQALLEQIEQAEQAQPVAWIHPKFKDQVSHVKWASYCEPLYTAPPQRQPLTDEEIDEIEQQIWSQTVDKGESMKEFVYKFARAVESAHGIKGEA